MHIEPDDLQNDDQNKLPLALERIKNQHYNMGFGLSEQDMYTRVMRSLLGTSNFMSVRAVSGKGEGGFTVRAVKTGEVLAVLTSSKASREIKGDRKMFQKLKWEARGEAVSGSSSESAANAPESDGDDVRPLHMAIADTVHEEEEEEAAEEEVPETQHNFAQQAGRRSDDEGYNSDDNLW